MVLRAAFPIARFIAGVDCSTVVRPAASALAVETSTTPAAALAAAPRASAATDFTPLAPRCVTLVITRFALLAILVAMSSSLNAKCNSGSKVPKTRNYLAAFNPAAPLGSDHWNNFGAPAIIYPSE
jgi:hypothetical protein